MSTKAFIYKIVSEKGPKCYIGSTRKRYLSNRWADHKSDYRRQKVMWCASKLLFDEYGMENCRCELIEEVEFKEKEEYLMRERYWIENTPDCVNRNKKPIASDEEQLQRARKRRKELYQEQKQSDPVKVQERQKIINDRRPKEKILCECGDYYSYTHKTRHFTTKKHQQNLENKNQSKY